MSLDQYWSDLVDYILTNKKEHLIERIAQNRHMPKKIFGGGGRWAEYPKKVQQEKIAKACEHHIDVRQAVCNAFRKCSHPVLSAISFANMFYDAQSDNDDLLRWLVVRFQPSLAQVEFFFDENKLVPQLTPGLNRIAFLHEGVYCDKISAAGYDASACDHDFEDLDGTLYEFINFGETCFAAHVPHIAKVGLLKYGEIAQEFLTSPGSAATKEIVAAYFFLLNNDSERAFLLLDSQMESVSKKAHLLALKVFNALSADRASDALSLLDEVKRIPANKGSFRDYPAWNLLRGICHDRLSSPIESAKAFLTEATESRAQSTYSIRMARRALERGGCTPPQGLLLLSERQMMAPVERRTLASNFSAWFDRPTPVSSAQLTSEVAVSHPLPKPLSDFKCAVEEYLRISQDIQKSAKVGDMEQVFGLTVALDPLHANLQEMHTVIKREFPGLVKIYLDRKPTIADLEGVLGKAGDFESAYLEFNVKQLDTLKKTLVAELESASIEPPADLLNAKNKEAVESLRNRLMPQILQQKTIRGLLAGKVSLSAEIPHELLLSCLASAVEQLSSFPVVAKFLGSLLALQDIIPLGILESTGSTVSRRIVMINDREGAPPMEVLGLASRVLSGEQFGDLISDLSYDHTKLTLLELKELLDLGGASGQPLQDVAVFRVAHIIFAENVTSQETATIIARFGGSSFLYKRLVELLYRENKIDECFYLCSLLVKSKFKDIDDALAPAIYLYILDRELKASPSLINHDVLHNLEWIQSVGDVVACVLICIQYSLPELFLNLKYLHKKLYEHTQERFSVLCRISDELLCSASLNGKSWDDYWNDIKNFEILLEEYMNFNQRESCYGAWPPAEDYQRFFLERLEHIRSYGVSTDTIDEQDVIDEAVKQGLPKVKHGAVDSMKAFLRSQLNRIDRMHTLQSDMTLPFLQAVEWRHALLQELAAAKALPTLSAIAPTIVSLERGVE